MPAKRMLARAESTGGATTNPGRCLPAPPEMRTEAVNSSAAGGYSPDLESLTPYHGRIRADPSDDTGHQHPPLRDWYGDWCGDGCAAAP